VAPSRDKLSDKTCRKSDQRDAARAFFKKIRWRIVNGPRILYVLFPLIQDAFFQNVIKFNIYI